MGKWELIQRVKLLSICLPFSLRINECYTLFTQCMCVVDMSVTLNSDYFRKQTKPLRLCIGDKLFRVKYGHKLVYN